jgi:hypothetical protein
LKISISFSTPLLPILPIPEISLKAAKSCVPTLFDLESLISTVEATSKIGT